MLPTDKVTLDNVFVQMALMALWTAQHRHEKTTDTRTAFKELKEIWSADTSDSPSARFRAYQKLHSDEKCDLHDAGNVGELLEHVLAQPTLH